MTGLVATGQGAVAPGRLRKLPTAAISDAPGPGRHPRAPSKVRYPRLEGWSGFVFEGFEEFDIATASTTIHGRRGGGQGPPVLLLHGIPETHLMWHRVAPRLAEQFTVVATDLRGFGGSGTPPSAPDHGPYSMREIARDLPGRRFPHGRAQTRARYSVPLIGWKRCIAYWHRPDHSAGCRQAPGSV